MPAEQTEQVAPAGACPAFNPFPGKVEGLKALQVVPMAVLSAGSCKVLLLAGLGGLGWVGQWWSVVEGWRGVLGCHSTLRD